MSAHIRSITTSGSAGTIIDIECHLSNNLPTIVIVGFANKAVNEARERIRGAFAASRIKLPRKRITINLAPADLPKADSGLDLGIAVAILAASGQISASLSATDAFIGELGLDGSTRPVRGIIGKLLAGRDQGFKTFYIPSANLAQAQLVPRITVIPVDSFSALYLHLNLQTGIHLIATGPGRQRKLKSVPKACAGLSEIAGHALAKRALLIALAGGHNLLLSGPPGTGKSMLAKAAPGLLPPLSHEESLEVTQLHSLTHHQYENIITMRPFRAPHHSASRNAILGGKQLLPGEISLAHRGILFLDELPEFERTTIEALRQPLEDRYVKLARSTGSVQYPAHFILIATANPCPCGYYGSSQDCQCQPAQIRRYEQKLSGPILDRIDLYSSVGEIQHTSLLPPMLDDTEDAAAQLNIQKARRQQQTRYRNTHKLNVDMTNSDVINLGRLTPAARAFLDDPAARLRLSPRAFVRTAKVARTIADLEASASVTEKHVSEALAYRPLANSIS